MFTTVRWQLALKINHVASGQRIALTNRVVHALRVNVQLVFPDVDPGSHHQSALAGPVLIAQGKARSHTLNAG